MIVLYFTTRKISSKTEFKTVNTERNPDNYREIKVFNPSYFLILD